MTYVQELANYVFFWEFYVSGLTFKSVIYFELILCVILDSGPASFFCMCLSYFEIPLIEETVVSPLCILGFFIINQLTVYAWVYFWTLLFCIILCSLFMPIPYHFDYYSFEICFQIREHDAHPLLAWQAYMSLSHSVCVYNAYLKPRWQIYQA